MDPVNPGDHVEEPLKIQYDYETRPVADLQNYLKRCNDKRDFGTKEQLDEILVESEEQVDWLETQFNRIQDIGIQNYLTEHMHESLKSSQISSGYDGLPN